MRINTARRTVIAIADEARQQGSSVTLYTGSGNLRCSRPMELHMFGYPDEIMAKLGHERDKPVAQQVHVRCRKCPECLRHRARLWTARAIDETKVSQRTWFGTLTLSPDRQTWARYSAHSILRKGGWGSDELSDNRVFQKSCQVIAPEITRFLKRVRKDTPFRYLLVTEQHKSGLPHMHILVHEFAGSVTKRVLEDKWRYGFSHWRLIPTGDEVMCGYVAKYLAKSALTRVRASERYGQGISALATERILGVTRDALAGIGHAGPGKSSLLNEGTPLPMDEGD